MDGGAAPALDGLALCLPAFVEVCRQRDATISPLVLRMRSTTDGLFCLLLLTRHHSL